MINIISKSVISNFTSGPQKVVRNLIRGLKKIGYPYIINGDLDSCTRLWIHDDIDALRKIKDLPGNIKVIIGPNLYIRPRHIPKEINIKRAIYLNNSKWNMDFWIDNGFNLCPMDVWPTGIDTETYKPNESKKEYVLIYFKQRFPEELSYVRNILYREKISHKIIIYGSYKETDYKKILEKTKYIIWIGRQESQGIALEEALSMDIPILVWDVKNLGHWLASKSEMDVFTKEENLYDKATVVPFFDERCGIIFKEIDQFESVLKKMESSWQNFKPREYILENLSLEKQARELITFYDKYFHLDYNSGLKEKKLNHKKWKNSGWCHTIFTYIKDLIKFIKSS